MNLAKNRRDYGIDILKIILIIMIVSHHSIVHGMSMVNLKTNSAHDLDFSLFILNSLFIIGVNAFYLISGYFHIKINIRKIVLLYIKAVLYSLLISIAFVIIDKNIISLHLLFNIFFPLKEYWFIAVYIAIVILSPFLNAMLENLSHKAQFSLVFVLIIISTIYGFCFNMVGIGDGYTLIQGIIMYIIGFVCSENKVIIEKSFSKIKSFLMYIVLSTFLFIIAYYLYLVGAQTKVWKLFSYHNPIIILSSFFFFFSFVSNERINNSNLIRFSKLSRYSLDVYLITDHYLLKQYIFIPLIYVINKTSQIAIFILVPLYSILLVILCLIILNIIQFLNSIILRIISNKH